jgi:hypothetical protein
MAGTTTPVAPQPTLTLKRQIDQGMQGADVRACKRAAARAGFPHELLTGITDEYTAADVANVKAFQQAKHLHVDGSIGQETFGALLPFFDALGKVWYQSFQAPSTYVNPLKDAQQLTLERTDQGVDYYAKKGSPILAIGNAQITRSTTTSHWCAPDPSPDAHGCVQYLLKDGDHAGEEIYVAEYIEPLVNVGDVVEAGHVIARFTRDPSSRVGIETGYIKVGTNNPCGPLIDHGAVTDAGKAFARFLRSLGCPTRDDPGPGTTHSPSHK